MYQYRLDLVPRRKRRRWEMKKKEENLKEKMKKSQTISGNMKKEK